MIKRSLLLLLPFAAFLCLTDIRAENNASIVRIQKDITFLASEECEGRGVQTKGIEKAADYIANTFKEAGLKPGGVEGTWFQPFSIAGGNATLGETNTATLRGPADQTTDLKMGKDFNVSGLSGTGKVNADVVFVGYGITDADKKYDDYKDIDVGGKWVVVIRKAPRAESKTEAMYPTNDPKNSLVYKIENATQHRAAGVIFVSDRATAKDTDDLMDFNYTSRGGAGEFPVLHFKRAVLETMLAGSEAKKLSDIEDLIDKESKPQSIALKNWKISGQTMVKRTIIQAKNVVGVLEGAGPLANETVIIGGHYDHLGRGEVGSLAKKEDAKLIHFGADDNGSGTTGVLELARRFGAIKNRQGRRIVFMAFSGEERGLVGSAHYANKEPLFPLKDTVFMLNLDMIGRLRPDNKTNLDALEVGGTGTAEGLDAMIMKLNEKYKFQLKKSPGGMGPSDHASFYPKQIPVFFFFTGLHPQYHRPSDTLETLNIEGLKKVVDICEDIILEVSTQPQRPKYLKVAGGLNPGSRAAVPSIRFQPGNYNDAEEKGVLVGDVTEGGPAEKGGLKKDDFIVEIAGRKVKDMDGYMAAMSLQKAGQPVEFIVDRSGKKVKITITPQ